MPSDVDDRAQLAKCLGCSEGILHYRLGGMCGDCDNDDAGSTGDAELARVRAQLAEYAESLAATRRESADRLSRIQELTCALPLGNELELIRRLFVRCKEDRSRAPDYHEMRALRAWLKRMDMVRP